MLPALGRTHDRSCWEARDASSRSRFGRMKPRARSRSASLARRAISARASLAALLQIVV
jgi:hypothetical protein